MLCGRCIEQCHKRRRRGREWHASFRHCWSSLLTSDFPPHVAQTDGRHSLFWLMIDDASCRRISQNKTINPPLMCASSFAVSPNQKARNTRKLWFKLEEHPAKHPLRHAADWLDWLTRSKWLINNDKTLWLLRWLMILQRTRYTDLGSGSQRSWLLCTKEEKALIEGWKQ